ncbi:MAG TPA: hypothetical protein DCF91_04455 [Porphyromonadaceae bacterium]|nr:hypothetical protein [Porphyromonadaceae bacterium]
MYIFSSIRELIRALDIGRELLGDMFEKRKSAAYFYEKALQHVSQERLDNLISKEIIRRNGQYIELDDRFLQFFEQFLDVNEEINVSYIQESILFVKQNILFYKQERNEIRQYNYLRTIKSALRRLERTAVRYIMDIQRNVDNTFKTEPNFKIKVAKLEDYARKRDDLQVLIEHVEHLITVEEADFLRKAMDDELKEICLELREALNQTRHNLIEVQKQIIEYLNRIKYQSKVLEKIRQIKYLKDQVELQSRSNICDVLEGRSDVVFEPNPAYPLKLSLDYLQTDEVLPLLRKLSAEQRKGAKIEAPQAGKIDMDYLEDGTEATPMINPEVLKKAFVKGDQHLYQFLQEYNYPFDAVKEDRIKIFCQLIALYDSEFDVSDAYERDGDIEYVIVYPKKK